MRARSCAELAEHRSAYVDGALADPEREQLLTHLVGCAACRREVDELRHVRSLLTRAGLTSAGDPNQHPPGDLSQRLVLIAGDEAKQPLWTRPFRRTGAGELPSRRRAVRTRTLVAVLCGGLAVLGLLGIGYLAAPQAGLAAVPDPAGQALAEFTAVVSSFPLDGRVAIALQGRPPSPGRGGGRPMPVALPAGTLAEPQAVALLVRAGQSGDQLSYTGTQVVTVARDGERLSAAVRVSNHGGQGADLSPERAGLLAADARTYVPSDSSTRMADADLISQLAEHYRLRGWDSQRYAGRSASVVEAIEPGAAPAAGALSGVRARWWLDDQTGLVLGQETYDGRGSRIGSSRLTELRFDPPTDQDAPAAPKTAPQTVATLTLSRADELRREGWVCADQLAGLPLLRLRTDRVGDPALVHLVYGDGLTTVSVIEQHGRLSRAPASASRDAALGAWVVGGMPRVAVWTSGDVVLTVVTDGSRDILTAAVAALPHEGLETPTTMERVRAGWSRILGR